MLKKFGSIMLACTLLIGGVPAMNCFAAQADVPYTLTIQGDEKGAQISENLVGLFFEDINWGADGGLSAELVHNTSFDLGDKLFAYDNIGNGVLTEASSTPIHPNNPTYAVFQAKESGDGFVNYGFIGGGMNFVEGDSYDFSIWAFSEDYALPFTVELIKDDGTVLAQADTDPVGTQWGKHTVSLVPTGSDNAGYLVVKAKAAGTVNIDMVSLIPAKRYKDMTIPLRADLVEAFANSGAKFLRFPGGCVAEGANFENMYNWKDTIGPLEQRKAKPNYIWDPRGTNENAFIYNQSYAVGFYEYFVLCEELGMEPIPVLPAAMFCQFKGTDGQVGVPMDEIQPWIDNALDLIEYANGDPATSKWAKMRADAGHPEPFNMKYIGIGNENNRWVYRERFAEFFKQIKAKYPDMKVIASEGLHAANLENDKDAPNPDNTLELDVVKNKTYDLVDQHFYPSAEALLDQKKYDNYDRNGPKVFAGEYAAHTSDKANNLYSAICEAVFMSGVERNGDVVELSCYAPLLAKVGANQWKPDLIWFDNQYAYLTPNYYVQSFYGRNKGDYVVPHTLTKSGADVVDTSGSIGFASWNTQYEIDKVTVSDISTGKVLYENDFNNPGDIKNWEVRGGTWEISGGKLRQTSNDAACNITLKDKTFTNYKVTVEGKKISGSEGFIVIFGYQDVNSYYYYNLGGWGNGNSAIERETPTDGKKNIGNCAHEPIETNVNYKMEVFASYNDMRFTRNGKQVASVTVADENFPVYTVVSRDEENGDYIIKMINNSDEGNSVRVRLEGVKDIWPVARVVELANDDNSIENSPKNPKAIVPDTYTIDNVSDDFVFNMKPNSVNVIRVSNKEKPYLERVELTANHTNINESATTSLQGFMSDGSKDDLLYSRVVYFTDKPGLITIDDYGTITARGGSGTAQVWAAVSLFGKEVETNRIQVRVGQSSGVYSGSYTVEGETAVATVEITDSTAKQGIFVLYDGQGKLQQVKVKSFTLENGAAVINETFDKFTEGCTIRFLPWDGKTETMQPATLQRK